MASGESSRWWWPAGTQVRSASSVVQANFGGGGMEMLTKLADGWMVLPGSAGGGGGTRAEIFLAPPAEPQVQKGGGSPQTNELSCTPVN